jgi:hypothetical protein
MSVTIKSWFAVHETGTKFYQVFAISSSASPRAYIVTHWGPYMLGVGCLPREIGQCKAVEVKRGEADWEADRTMSSKLKRGYRFVPNLTKDIHESDELSSVLYRYFKASHAAQIYTGLTGDDSYTNPAVGGMNLEDLPRPPKPTEDAGPKHEEWGTW